MEDITVCGSVPQISEMEGINRICSSSMVNIDGIALNLERNSGPQCPPVSGWKAPGLRSEVRGYLQDHIDQLCHRIPEVGCPWIDSARWAPVISSKFNDWFLALVRHPNLNSQWDPSCGKIEVDSLGLSLRSLTNGKSPQIYDR